MPRGSPASGHDVIFVEDTAEWALSFDPVKGFASADSSHRAEAALNDAFEKRIGLAGRWAYNTIFENKLYGMERVGPGPPSATMPTCSSIVSGVIPLRENVPEGQGPGHHRHGPHLHPVNKIANDDWTRDYYIKQPRHLLHLGPQHPGRRQRACPSPAWTGRRPTRVPVVLDMLALCGLARHRASPPSAPGTPRAATSSTRARSSVLAQVREVRADHRPAQGKLP